MIWSSCLTSRTSCSPKASLSRHGSNRWRSVASARSSASDRTARAPSCSSRTARTSRSSSASRTARLPTCKPRRRSTSSPTLPRPTTASSSSSTSMGWKRLRSASSAGSAMAWARCSWATTPRNAASTASSTTSSSTRFPATPAEIAKLTCLPQPSVMSVTPVDPAAVPPGTPVNYDVQIANNSCEDASFNFNAFSFASIPTST